MKHVTISMRENFAYANLRVHIADNQHICVPFKSELNTTLTAELKIAISNLKGESSPIKLAKALSPCWLKISLSYMIVPKLIRSRITAALKSAGYSVSYAN